MMGWMKDDTLKVVTLMLVTLKLVTLKHATLRDVTRKVDIQSPMNVTPGCGWREATCPHHQVNEQLDLTHQGLAYTAFHLFLDIPVHLH